jgi:hypothetical protein
MPPELLEPLPGLIGLLAFGGLILLGMKMRYSHRQRMRVGGVEPQDVERLAKDVDTMRHEIRLLREEVLGLNNRVESTERLLERPKSG